tara:strand:- start:88 stop:603 length:516 start_codon:yes stop_codon:yes gene_type:complete
MSLSVSSMPPKDCGWFGEKCFLDNLNNTLFPPDRVNPNHKNLGPYDPLQATFQGPTYQGEKVNFTDPNSAPGRFEDPKGIYDPYSKENQAKADLMKPKYPFNDQGIIAEQTKPDKDCGWFGEKCLEFPKIEFPKFEFPDLGNIPLYIGGGIMAYFLLKSFGKTIIKGKLGI